jgi:hypothetical protein
MRNLKKRKTMNCKAAAIIFSFLVSCGAISAQKENETRNYIKSFKATRDASLEVVNKYGSVHLSSWNKDSISVRAEVKAFAPSQPKLAKMFEGVKVDITDTKYLIRATTEFSSSISGLFESFKGMTGKVISYDSRIEINYYINAPEYIDVTIENRYGDVSAGNIGGRFSLTLSNGDFRADSIGKSASLTLSFTDATIHSLASGKIDANFSEVKLDRTGDIEVSSISSRFDIKEAASIRCESRRDKFFIESIGSLSGNSYFTDFRIGNLKKSMDINDRYGNINTDQIARNFSSVNVISTSSDISLRFDKGSSYNLDIRHINAFVVLPDNDANIEKKALNEEKKEYTVYGTVGKNPGSAKVKLDATRGNIYIK